MKERQQILKSFSDAEDRLLAAHLLDKLEWTANHNRLSFSRFLTVHEGSVAEQVAEWSGFFNHIMTGGVSTAERKVMLFLPDYLAPEDVAQEDLPFGVICAEWGRGNTATHRDVLGSLMAIGIRRDTLGDILIDENGCHVIAMKECLPFLLSNWESAGRVRFHPKEASLDELTIPASDGEDRRDTVASLRLDAVLASGFSMSRTKAAALITSGKVTRNGRESLKTDILLSEGDLISVRGFGRLKLKAVGELSRKGRIWIELEKFG